VLKVSTVVVTEGFPVGTVLRHLNVYRKAVKKIDKCVDSSGQAGIHGSRNPAVESVGSELFAAAKCDLISIAVSAKLETTFERVDTFDPCHVVIEVDRAIVDVTRSAYRIQNSTQKPGHLKIRCATTRRERRQSSDA